MGPDPHGRHTVYTPYRHAATMRQVWGNHAPSLWTPGWCPIGANLHPKAAWPSSSFSSSYSKNPAKPSTRTSTRTRRGGFPAQVSAYRVAPAGYGNRLLVRAPKVGRSVPLFHRERRRTCSWNVTVAIADTYDDPTEGVGLDGFRAVCVSWALITVGLLPLWPEGHKLNAGIQLNTVVRVSQAERLGGL